MKFLKIFFLTFCFLMTFNSVASADVDFRNGWFDNNPGKFTVTDIKAIDNDESTYAEVNSSKPLIINFNEGINIDVLSIYVHAYSYTHSYNFYDENDVLLHKETLTVGSGATRKEHIYLNLFGVKKIVVDRTSTNKSRIYEMEIFEQAPRYMIKNLKVTNKTHSSFKLSWENPESNDFSGVMVKIDGQVLEMLSGDIESFNFGNLDIEKEYEIEFSALYNDGSVSKPQKILVKTEKPPTVKDLKVLTTSNSATLSWVNGVSDNLAVRVLKDGVIVEDLPKNQTSYTITNLEESTDYTYQVALIFKGNIESDKREINFKTDEAGREILSLTALTGADFVDLKWTMPNYQNLDFARIYRKKAEEGIVSRFFSLFSQSDYTPLFETNGTTFKDLTVSSDEKYVYKITTVDKNQKESDGVTLSVQTKKIGVIGSDIKPNPNGDYVITWEKPTTGKIKVLIGGEEYRVVLASDKSITIPAADMKLNAIGFPDVQLIPVSDDGKEGIHTIPGGGGSGGIGTIIGGGQAADVNANNLLQISIKLFALVGLFTLLGMSFWVVPKLIRLISKAFVDRKQSDTVEVGRRTS